MSIQDDDVTEGAHAGASSFPARAVVDDARADARLAAAVAILSQPVDMAVDDRMRAMVGSAVTQLIADIEGKLRVHAGRTLAARGAPELATTVLESSESVEQPVLAAGLLNHPPLVRALVGGATHDLVAAGLPLNAPLHDDQPSLVSRLSTSPDGVVSAAAISLLTAEARRRPDNGGPGRIELPADLHHRLVWWIAAAIAAQLTRAAGGPSATVDKVMTDAALRSLAAHDEGDRAEAAAMQLAAAIDANVDELPELLTEALGDRQLTFFIALIAHAMRIGYDVASDVVLDPDADRLWLVLRALDVPRSAIARIGLSLSEGDPRRDIDAFAGQIDAIAAIDPDHARNAVAPLRRHPDFRAAAIAIARGAVA